MRCWGTKRPLEIRCGKGLGYERATARPSKPPQLATSPYFSGTRFLRFEKDSPSIIAAMSQRMSKPPECDSCHAQMERLGKLPAMLTKRAVEVFRCAGCKAIKLEEC